MKLILNPDYILKPEKGKALLLTADPFRAKNNEKLESVIHPIHAMILSFFDGKEIELCIEEASQYLNVNKDKIVSFVSKLRNNEQPTIVKFEGKCIYFPQNTLVEINNNISENIRLYNPDDFKYDYIDLKMGRHSMITDVTLMLTTRCKTDCIYCYATKQHCSKELPLSKIMSLIDEAFKLKMRGFDIIGGDVFAHPHWKEILSKLYSKKFNPFVSTKVPLNEEDVRFLASIGVKDIQISLDTLIPENLNKIVHSKSTYYQDIIKTLNHLDKYNIKTVIHTIICKENDTIDDIKSLETELFKHSNIYLWRIDPATYSMPKGVTSFENYKTTKQKLIEIYDYIKTQSYPIRVLANSLYNNANKIQKKNNNNFIENRVLCTANYSHLFILPDGKVTICEQLYWNPTFIVGDVLESSLADIWISDKTRYLYNLPQEDISDDSSCKTCKDYTICRQQSGGVCWKEVIAAYGTDKWDYPDPSCPHAPNVYNDIYL